MLHGDGAFQSPAVDGFVRQYLDVVKRRILPRASAVDSFETLRTNYAAFLKQLLDILESEGDDGLTAAVPSDRSEFKSTVVRLVTDFRREPERLRSAAREVFKRRNLKTVLGVDRARTWFGLYWEDSAEVEKALGLRSCLRWGVSFTRRSITVGFYLYQWPRKRRGKEHGKMQAVLEQLKRFISRTPVDRQQSDYYPSKEFGDYFFVCDRKLVDNEELSSMSRPRPGLSCFSGSTSFWTRKTRITGEYRTTSSAWPSDPTPRSTRRNPDDS